MSDIDDLKAQIAAAKAQADGSALTEDEVGQAKLLAELDEHKAKLRNARVQRAAIAVAAAESAARKVAAGRYLIKGISLVDLLAEADPKDLPGNGVIVVRSPPTEPRDCLADYMAEAEQHERPLPDITIDHLVIPSIVFPDIETDASIRQFFDSTRGKGSAITVGNAVTALGGMAQRQAKRGRR